MGMNYSSVDPKHFKQTYECGTSLSSSRTHNAWGIYVLDPFNLKKKLRSLEVRDFVQATCQVSKSLTTLTYGETKPQKKRYTHPPTPRRTRRSCVDNNDNPRLGETPLKETVYHGEGS